MLATLSALCAVLLFTVSADAKGCTAVSAGQCGTDYWNNCLKCGTKSDYDCEQCCSGCSKVNKGGYQYCECGKPGPGPAPTPPDGPDSWDNYNIAGLDVLSMTGGHNKSDYQKVVIMLHGGGGSGTDWEYQYQNGWFGSLTGFKYVFPTSAQPGHVWYIDFKDPHCGLNDDCAYNISSIEDSASRIAALIDHEKKLVGGDASKVYLAGFSEGAQMTSYMQLAKLDFALAGTIVMDGYPLPPLVHMPGADPAAAKRNATYYGSDMKWMIWWGASDPIFPATASINAYNGIFDTLGIRSTIKIEHTEPGMTHTLIKSEFDQMVQFIGGSPAPPSPPGPTPPGPSGGDYICYFGQCYSKPGAGKETKAQCEATCH